MRRKKTENTVETLCRVKVKKAEAENLKEVKEENNNNNNNGERDGDRAGKEKENQKRGERRRWWVLVLNKS